MKLEELFKEGDTVDVTVIETQELVRDNPVKVDKIVLRQMYATDSAGFERVFHQNDFRFRPASEEVCV